MLQLCIVGPKLKIILRYAPNPDPKSIIIVWCHLSEGRYGYLGSPLLSALFCSDQIFICHVPRSCLAHDYLSSSASFTLYVHLIRNTLLVIRPISNVSSLCWSLLEIVYEHDFPRAAYGPFSLIGFEPVVASLTGNSSSSV